MSTRPSAAQVITLTLEVLLGCGDFVFDKNAYSSPFPEDAEEEIALTVSIA